MAEEPKGKAAASGRRQRVESVEPEERSREISRLERLIEGVRAECVELRFEVGEEGRFAVRGRILLQEQEALRRHIEIVGASVGALGAFQRVVSDSQAAIEAVEQRVLALERRSAEQERRLVASEQQIRDLNSERSGLRQAEAERRIERAEDRLAIAEDRILQLSVLQGIESGVRPAPKRHKQ